MENRELHPNLQAALQLVEGIFQMLGSRYEVILHDLSHVESSIVALAGDVTHRKIGGNVTTDGRILRSSTIFIRDENGHIVGSLCINQDLTDYIVASRLHQEMVSFQYPAEEDEAEELFAHDISEVMEDMVRTELGMVQKPVAYMQKEDKLSIVGNLANRGIFDVKGSVEYVAECLGVTNFTVYNYLKELRVKNK